MSDAIVTTSTPTSKHGMDVFNRMSVSTGYLPYVRLYDPSAKDSKKGLIQGGTFGVTRARKIIPLGKQFNCILLAWRPKVLKLPEGKNKAMNYFDPASKEFDEGLKLSTVKDSGYLAGPEFLIYIPEMTMYAAFFMSNTTSKNEAANVVEMVGKAVTFESKFIETTSYSWFGPVTTLCSLPMPNLDEKEKQTYVDTFLNPKAKVVDEAEEVPEGTQRQDR